jgi:uncharacterized protein DUF1259
MKSTLRSAAGLVATLLNPFVLPAAPPAPAAPSALVASLTVEIDRVLGATGTWNEKEEVYKVTFPRSDVAVRVDGLPLPPFLGLTSWVAFKDAGGGTSMMMGDLVLFQDEVSPVMDALLGRGAEVTALHNHFFYDDPRVFFMHVGGTGKAGDLAGAVRAALDTTRKTREARPAPPAVSGRPAPPKSALDAAALDAALGTHGQSKDGMYKAVFGRKARHGGVDVGADMGINTWAAFAGTATEAVVDGDFAVREAELQTVLKTLRKGGVDIVAIHQHMTGEEPRLIFLHYWARGEATRLASTVKQALTALEP